MNMHTNRKTYEAAQFDRGASAYPMTVEMPWPPAILSGHAKGKAFYAKSKATADLRAAAKVAAAAAGVRDPGPGDIRVVATFYPPNRKGDRVNYPNRLKPLWDGLADAMGVNDSRFLPSFVFAEPVKDARVVLSVLA